jgi:hypothetical protein
MPHFTRDAFFSFLHRDAPGLLTVALVLLLILGFSYLRFWRQARGYVHDTHASVESHRAEILWSRYPRMYRLVPRRVRRRTRRDQRRWQRYMDRMTAREGRQRRREGELD